MNEQEVKSLLLVLFLNPHLLGVRNVKKFPTPK